MERSSFRTPNRPAFQEIDPPPSPSKTHHAGRDLHPPQRWLLLGAIPRYSIGIRSADLHFMKRLLSLVLLALGWFCLFGHAAETNQTKVIRDIQFARVNDLALELDLHLPIKSPPSLIILWVHGGAWRSGSKASMPLGKLVEAGFAVVSVNDRLSTQAKFPAQFHDIKAAIRFLRGRGAQWKLPTKHIVIAGDSAGGHLAALVGQTTTSFLKGISAMIANRAPRCRESSAFVGERILRLPSISPHRMG